MCTKQISVVFLCVCVLQDTSEEEGKLDCMLKAEAGHAATNTEPQDEWKMASEGMD